MSKYRSVCNDLDADIKEAAQKIRDKPLPQMKPTRERDEEA